ncbi:MAG: undecaprenyl-diphosphate phosphatase [Thermoproteota archaeon]
MLQAYACISASILLPLLIKILIGEYYVVGGSMLNDFPESVLLGFIQGMTEWFPISSSGHLVILQELMGINVSVTFDVMLHLGTLASVTCFFRRELSLIIRALIKADFSSSEGRMIPYMVLGTIPVTAIGFLFKGFFESLFSNIFSTGIALIVNGFILYSTRYSKPIRKLNATDSILIGLAQAAAIVPGLSRTGMTVSTALLRGVKNEDAYMFSILLSFLSILGGCVVKLGDLNIGSELHMILTGMLAAAVVGYIMLRILRRIVLTKRFHMFAYYCVAAGVVILLLGTVRA